jgi:hypothetical protein
MRPLHVVVPHEGSGHGCGVFQICRPIQSQALCLIGAVVPFDKSVLLGVLRIADLHLDAQAGTKAHQGRRKIAACRTAHPARIAIQGDALGAAILG